MSTSEEILTRQATNDDLPTLLEFEQGIATTERPLDPTLKTEKFHYYDLAEMLSADHIMVVVAVCNGEIIGSGYARIENGKPYQRYAEHAYLGFMFVLPSFRGKGVNEQIVNALKEFVRSRGITELQLDVYEDNLPAVRAYEKQGFKKLLVQMRMNIAD